MTDTDRLARRLDRYRTPTVQGAAIALALATATLLTGPVPPDWGSVVGTGALGAVCYALGRRSARMWPVDQAKKAERR